MSIPPSYSGRPLWIILIVDAALTPVGIYAAVRLLGINDPLQAIRTGALATGVVVGAGVVLVGVGSIILDALTAKKTDRAVEEITTETPTSYTPPRPAVPTRVTMQDRRRPAPIPLPSNPNQCVSPANGGDAGDEELETVAVVGSNDTRGAASVEEVFAAENN